MNSITSSVTTKKLIMNALMIALVFITTRFTAIPGLIPQSYINLGDAVIIAAAVLLGRKAGLLAGAVGSMLADIAFGAYLYAPVTFIVKGLEGYIIGAIGYSEDYDDKAVRKRLLLSSLAGILVMIAGYFIAEAYLLGFINSNLGLAAAITNLPLNLIQGSASIIVGFILTYVLIKGKIMRYIK